MNRDKEICRNDTVLMCDTLSSLGYTVNKKKSVLVPTQRLIFFGFVLDSVLFMVFLTDEKVQKIVSSASNLLQKEVVVVRDLASFIGLVINAFYAVLEAPLHYRSLERNKLLGLGSNMNFDNKVVLSKDSREELLWWKNNVTIKNGKHIRPGPVEYWCYCDASFVGWGSYDEELNKSANGRWNSSLFDKSINYLELLAIFNAVRALYNEVRDTHIEIKSDNVSAIAYVNDLGGMTSLSMDLLAKDLWEWCLSRDIFLSASYIPGVDNVYADYFSRNFSESTEWSLKPDIFERICGTLFKPDIDLFASEWNKKLDRYVSWFSGSTESAYDSFTMSWSGFTPYLFPPFNLVGKVMNKVLSDKVNKAILVFPFWKSATWFPLVLYNIISFPIRLPRHRDLLSQEHNGKTHPLQNSLTMVAVVISGKHYKVREFQDQLHVSLLKHGRKEPSNSMNSLGVAGIFGVINKVKVPFQRLKVL
ncbi:uncharacterized protein LOC132714949 [Ruditapes philippinarum]|uniref:uncharacterized protein LOC132714949 n=1 Tax=Ruditapes philippinarum TaxID=129788 RepID=UPI00295A57C2|nr:uncharacterized protein LOC132714949 [Ruditapes philippinarum]